MYHRSRVGPSRLPNGEHIVPEQTLARAESSPGKAFHPSVSGKPPDTL